jgi:membrane protease subunit HflK
MAWNQPGEDKNRPAQRGAPDDSRLDEMLRRWQRRMEVYLRPSGGAAAFALTLLLLLVALWLAAGFYQVDASERGVVQRFGRYVEIAQPGWGWHWPWPVETVTKVNVGSVDSIDAKSIMLTQDLNLLSVGWSVQYQLVDPLQYLFQLRDPQATLQQQSESALRTQLGRTAMDAAFSAATREQIATAARAQVQQALDAYHSGIRLVGFSLSDVQVPDAVLAAQRDASKALEERARKVQDARGYAAEILPKAQIEAQRQIQDAQAYKAQVGATAEGDVARFEALLPAYSAAPEVTRNRLYIETMEALLARSHKIIIDTKAGTGGNVIYLPLDKLVEFARATAPVTAPGASAPAATAPEHAAPADTATDVDGDTRSRDRTER